VNSLAQVRLMQLASQALPIGGFSHSHGLESAVELGTVKDEASTLRFIADVFEFSMLTCEIPYLMAMERAWAMPVTTQEAALRDLGGEFLATRETAELRAASVQMGYSLRALLCALPDMPAACLRTLLAIEEVSLPCAWSAAAAAWQIESRESALGYAWSWAENHVLAAMKTVPLGQSAGQRVLLELGTRMARDLAKDLSDLEAGISNFTPALAILSARHETQYSRLFRS
jgi:urease accessory protein